MKCKVNQSELTGLVFTLEIIRLTKVKKEKQKMNTDEILVNKIKLKPTKKQEAAFELNCRISKFAYNWALRQNKTAYGLLAAWMRSYGSFAKRNKKGKINPKHIPQNCKFKSGFDLIKILNKRKKDDVNFEWILKGSTISAETGISQCDDAWQRFFKMPDVNQPKFKNRNSKKSYLAGGKVSEAKGRQSAQVDGKKIKLAKIGWVKMASPLYYEGFISGVTVSKSADGWYAAIAVKHTQLRHERRDTKECGIDMGIKGFVAKEYDGEKIVSHDIRNIDKIQKQIKKLNKSISRKYEKANHGKARNEKKFFSKKYKAECEKRNKLLAKLTRMKEYDLHNITTGLVLNNEFIGMEDLDVAGLKQNTTKSPSLTNRQKNNINKKYDDKCLGKFKQMVEYKSRLYGTNLVKVSKWYASSKTCSHCGSKNEHLEVSQREWTCGFCGTYHDRDENAAKNILNEAKRISHC